MASDALSRFIDVVVCCWCCSLHSGAYSGFFST